MEGNSREMPTPEIMREVAEQLFEKEAGLHVMNDSWRYHQLAEKGVAAARFALSDGKKTVFNHVLVAARYEASKPVRLKVLASIHGFSPTSREFFVTE